MARRKEIPPTPEPAPAKADVAKVRGERFETYTFVTMAERITVRRSIDTGAREIISREPILWHP